MGTKQRFLYILIFLTGLVLLTIKYGSVGYYRHKNISLSNVYKSSFYYKLKQAIKQQNKVILFGQKHNGVQEFVENYLNNQLSVNKTLEILWRDVRAGYDIDFKKHPLFCYAYYYGREAYKYLFKSQQKKIKLWVLNNIEAPCSSINKQLGKFVAQHPKDKILIICRKDKASFKKTLQKNSYVKSLRFKILEYIKPELDTLIKGLEKYSNNETVMKNMINYYQNDLSKINHLFLGFNPINFFVSEFDDEFVVIDTLKKDQKVDNTLAKLCAKGSVKYNDNQSYILTGGSIVSQEEEKLYWSSNKALFAYQIMNEVECVTPLKYAEPREIIEIPELDLVYPLFSKGKESNEEEKEEEQEE